MPQINKKYTIQLPFENVYTESLEALRQMSVQDIKEVTLSEQIKTIEGFQQSIWGWGGMTIKIDVEKSADKTMLCVGGYIAQLAVSPLTKKLDEFLSILAQRLQAKHHYNFTYEKMNAFLPQFSYSINKKDMSAIGIILLFGLITTLIGVFIGRGTEALIYSLAIGLSLFFGRKYFYHK